MSKKKRIKKLKARVSYLERLVDLLFDKSEIFSETAMKNYDNFQSVSLDELATEIAHHMYNAINGISIETLPLPEGRITLAVAREYIAGVYAIEPEDIDVFMAIDGRYV